jgi:hypothetical protein
VWYRSDPMPVRRLSRLRCCLPAAFVIRIGYAEMAVGRDNRPCRASWVRGTSLQRSRWRDASALFRGGVGGNSTAAHSCVPA